MENKDDLRNNSSSIESKSDETGKPSSNINKPVQTSQPSTAIHTHNYSKSVTAATCTERGYTTYTCSCGDTYKDDYTDFAHTYSKYKCSKCGEIDKLHTFEYLVNWVSTNGTANGQYYEIEFLKNERKFAIVYDKQNNGITLSTSETRGDYFFLTDIIFTEISETYYYSNLLYDLAYDSCAIEFWGSIECEGYTKNTPLTYDGYKSDVVSGVDNTSVDTARTSICLLLLTVDALLTGEWGSAGNSGLTIADLGFVSFMDSLS